MKFRVEADIWEAFPGLHIGLLRAQGVDNLGDCPEILEKIHGVQERIKRDFHLDTLAEAPKIQNWREAFEVFGAKPKKHRSSVENLYRITLEGKDIRPINRLVDIYNYISLLHMIPVGGDDLGRIEGDIVLKFALGDESFLPLGSGEIQTARRGEVIYADDKEVLCRRWNWRESEKSKMTGNTQDVLLVCEGLPPVTAEEIGKAVQEMERLVELYCGGKTCRGILSSGGSVWEP